MNKSNFILYNEVYNLYINLYPILRKFPKSEKFTLSKEINQTFFDLLLTLDRFTRLNQKDKISQIKKINYLFDKFKLLIRISNDLDFISQSQYLLFFERYELIGKLIGGLERKFKF